MARHLHHIVPASRLLLCVAAMGVMRLSPTADAKTLVIAYAGSMGPLMDRHIGPQFSRQYHVKYQGIGRGAFGLARMIKAGELHPDVFISITRGPTRVLEKAGLVKKPVAFASTRMVLAWSRHSRIAGQFAALNAGHGTWYQLLASPTVHFGRTDPLTDPQGRSTVLSLMLAARYYHQPKLAARILGPVENPAQIFTEASLMFRLRAGQLDACITYQSAAQAAALPFFQLPPEMNLGQARFSRRYSAVVMRVKAPDGQTQRFHAHPLIFYCAVLTKARHPRLAGRFAAYLNSKIARPLLVACGYTPLYPKISSPGVVHK